MQFTLLSLSAGLLALAQADQTLDNVRHTFYGFPDNDPPGAGISMDCGRGFTAGGDGSFNNPLTFASAPGEFNNCEVIWDPYTRKYLRFEDFCQACNDDFANGQNHIDIFIGSTTENGGDAVKSCEDQLTPNNNPSVVRFGSSGNQANTGPLFDGTCHSENVFP